MHRLIAEELRGTVLSGERQIGDSIPSEAQLAEAWGVSRGPVRQALATLRADGIIGGGPGKPAVVRARKLSQSFETFLSFSRWVTAVGGTPGQRTIEIAKRPASTEVADALHLEVGSPVVQLVRLRLLDGEPTMVERTSFVEPVGRLLFDFDCDSGSIYSHLTEHGADLSYGRHVIDAVSADAVDAGLLDIPLGAPLLRERRLAGNDAGELYEYSDDHYRPEIVTFSIENRQDAPSLLLRATTST
jgi:GntR family transcriptional regulator